MVNPLPEHTDEHCEALADLVVDKMSTKEMERVLADMYAEAYKEDEAHFYNTCHAHNVKEGDL